jgi:GNAT superfamily N-acetyltransferase
MTADAGVPGRADVSVRPLRLTDVDAVVELQLRAWSGSSAQGWAIPPVGELDPGVMRRSWEHAALVPPDERHHALVAVADGVVVGIAAVVPAADPDGSVDAPMAELTLLLVDPGHRGRGHGSRLLAACVDVSRDQSLGLVCWLPSAADDARAFLAETGWEPDGAYRTVHVGDEERTVHEVRYATFTTG